MQGTLCLRAQANAMVRSPGWVYLGIGEDKAGKCTEDAILPDVAHVLVLLERHCSLRVLQRGVGIDRSGLMACGGSGSKQRNVDLVT